MPDKLKGYVVDSTIGDTILSTTKANKDSSLAASDRFRSPGNEQSFLKHKY